MPGPRTPALGLRLLLAASLGCLALAAEGSGGLPIEEAAAALAADDVCAAGDAEGECSLELRLLRATELRAQAEEHSVATAAGHQEMAEASAEEAEENQEMQAKQPSTTFGPDAIGEDMWTEATWGDIVNMFQSNVSAGSGADANSEAAGTPYGASGYGSSGYGSSGYGSGSQCVSATGGTCGVFSCSQSRGATKCVSGACLCESGYCALHGFCYPASASACLADTGGTCNIGSCSSSRGVTKCKGGSCLCKTGGCAWKGQCFPVTDTGGSCSLMSCSSSRGATTCHKGRCLCKSGYVADGGRCVSYH